MLISVELLISEVQCIIKGVYRTFTSNQDGHEKHAKK